MFDFLKLFGKVRVRVLLMGYLSSIVATTRPKKSPQAEAVGLINLND